MTSETQRESAAWAEPFLRDLLDRWRTAADDPSGLFYPYLDREWNRREGGPLTLVSQCRLIYNFSRACELFQDARFAEAAQRGLAALQAHFRVSPGRYRWAVTHQGEEADATPDAYGHAFCILAQATAARVFADPSLVALALETWDFVAVTFADTHGGLQWRRERDPARQNLKRSQNPLMHLFEALMALHSVDSSGRAQLAARDLLAFVWSLSEFGQGRLIERYTDDWQPLPPDAGGAIDLGHAFEWAWLLSEWHAITQASEILETGKAFLRTGIGWGLDADGGVWDACDAQGRITSAAKGLWQQCETIRAMHRYAVRHDLDTPWPRSLAFFRRRFVDEVQGGVFAIPEGLGRAVSLHKGDAWKLDYHTTGLCLELLG